MTIGFVYASRLTYGNSSVELPGRCSSVACNPSFIRGTHLCAALRMTTLMYPVTVDVSAFYTYLSAEVISEIIVCIPISLLVVPSRKPWFMFDSVLHGEANGSMITASQLFTYFHCGIAVYVFRAETEIRSGSGMPTSGIRCRLLIGVIYQ